MTEIEELKEQIYAIQRQNSSHGLSLLVIIIALCVLVLRLL